RSSSGFLFLRMARPPRGGIDWAIQPCHSLRVEYTSAEQHGVGLSIPDEEQEGMVGLEDDRLLCRTTQASASEHEYGGGRCRFGSFLVDFHECLVDDLGNLQGFISDAAKVGFVTES